MPTPKVNLNAQAMHGNRRLGIVGATAVTPYTAKIILSRFFRDVAESLAQAGDPLDGTTQVIVTVDVRRYRRI
jgi:hypothetical protein